MNFADTYGRHEMNNCQNIRERYKREEIWLWNRVKLLIYAM